MGEDTTRVALKKGVRYCDYPRDRDNYVESGESGQFSPVQQEGGSLSVRKLPSGQTVKCVLVLPRQIRINGVGAKHISATKEDANVASAPGQP